MDNVFDDLGVAVRGMPAVPKCIHHVLDVRGVLINRIYQLVLAGSAIGAGSWQGGLWLLVSGLGSLHDG